MCCAPRQRFISTDRWSIMTKADLPYTQTSTTTTGGDPIEGADPGGTRSTKPGQRDKNAPKAEDAKIQQTVTSGDRNVQRESRGPLPKPD